jgi:hypothetical protein
MSLVKTDISFTHKTKRLVNLYNSVENKCINTARTEEEIKNRRNIK